MELPVTHLSLPLSLSRVNPIKVGGRRLSESGETVDEYDLNGLKVK